MKPARLDAAHQLASMFRFAKPSSTQKESNSSESVRVASLHEIQFRNDKQGQKLAELWKVYMIKMLQNEKTAAFIDFATCFISHFESQNYNVSEFGDPRQGHPTSVIQEVCRLFLTFIYVEDGKNRELNAVDWAEKAREGPVDLDTLVVRLKDIISDLDQLDEKGKNESPKLEEKRSFFFLIVSMLSTLSRWSHNRYVMAAKYKSAIPTLVVAAMRAFSVHIDETIVGWLDISREDNSGMFPLASRSIFILSTVSGLVQFCSRSNVAVEGISERCRSPSLRRQPWSAHDIAMLGLEVAGSARTTEAVRSPVSNIPVEEGKLSSAPDSDKEKSSSWLGWTAWVKEDPDPVGLELRLVGAVRAIISLLKKLSQLSQGLIGSTAEVDSFQSVAKFEIGRKIWLNSIVAQCECIFGLIVFISSNPTLSIDQFISRAGLHDIQCISSMIDVPKVILTGLERNLLTVRGTLCIRLCECLASFYDGLQDLPMANDVQDNVLSLAESVGPLSLWLLTLNSASSESIRVVSGVKCSCPAVLQMMPFASENTLPGSRMSSTPSSAYLANSVFGTVESRSLFYRLSDSVSVQTKNRPTRDLEAYCFDPERFALVKIGEAIKSSACNPSSLVSSVVDPIQLLSDSSDVQQFFSCLFDLVEMCQDTFGATGNVFEAVVDGISRVLMTSGKESAAFPAFQTHFLIFLGNCLRNFPIVTSRIIWRPSVRCLLLQSPLFLASGQRTCNRVGFGGVGMEVSVVDEEHNGFVESWYTVSTSIQHSEVKKSSSGLSLDVAGEVLSISTDSDRQARLNSADCSTEAGSEPGTGNIENAVASAGLSTVSVARPRAESSETFGDQSGYTESSGTGAGPLEGKVSVLDQYGTSMVLLHDLILEVLWISVEIRFLLQPEKARAELPLDCEDLVSLFSTETSDDVITQVARWLTNVAQLYMDYSLRSNVWLEILNRSLTLCRSQVSSMNSPQKLAIKSFKELSLEAELVQTSKSRPFFWPARVAVIELMFKILKFSSSAWMSLFIPNSDAAASKESLRQLSSGSLAPTKVVMGSPQASAANKTHRHTVLLRLSLDPRCSEVALFMITRIFQACGKHMAALGSLNLSSGKPAASGPGDSTVVATEQISVHEALLHDFIRGLVSIVRNASRQPPYIDGFKSATRILLYISAFLRDRSSAKLLPQYHKAFEDYGPCCPNHAIFNWTHSRTNIYRDLLFSLEDALHHARAWTSFMKAEFVRSGLSFIAAIVWGSEKNRENLRLFMLQRYRKPGLGNLSTYHEFVELITLAENPVSFQTCLVLMEMMLDGDFSCAFASENPEGATPHTDGLFCDTSSYPLVSNFAVVPLLLNLVPYFETAVQKCVLKTFMNLINGDISTVNLSRLTQMQPSIIDLVLELFPQLSVDMQPFAVELLQQLGRHSISVAELKRLFRLMHVQNEQYRQQYVTTLLDCLAGMIRQNSGPKYFFYFQGYNSGLQLPPLKKWPASRGYAFSVWFSIRRYHGPAINPSFSASDSRDDSSVSTPSKPLPVRPVLLSLRQKSGFGLEVSFTQGSSHKSKQKLVFKIYSMSKGLQTIEIPFAAQSEKSDCQRWHHLAFSHLCSNFRSKSEMTVLLNGESSKHEFTYPRFSEPIVSPMIGDCAVEHRDTIANNAFCGEMSTIYFFSEPFGEGTLRAIYDLGSGYATHFQELDSQVTPHIMLMLNPGVSRNGQFVDNTPPTNQTRWSSSSSEVTGARPLQGTFKCTTRDMRNGLDCLGGIKALLPLFAQVDLPIFGSDFDTFQSEDGFCLKLLNLIFLLLRDTAENYNLVDSNNGFALLGYFLERIAPSHLTMSVMESLLQRTLDLSWNRDWQDAVIKQILCNFKIWIAAPFSVQSRLFEFLLSLIRQDSVRALSIISVQRLLDSLSMQYTILTASSKLAVPPTNQSALSDNSNAAPPDASGQSQSLSLALPLPPSNLKVRRGSILGLSSASSGGGQSALHSLSESELALLRGTIFQMIYSLIFGVDTVVSEEIQSIVAYISNESIAIYKIEGLRLLLQVISSQSSAPNDRILLSISSKRSMLGLLALLTNRKCRVRLYALVVICSIVQLTTSRCPEPSNPVIATRTLQRNPPVITAAFTESRAKPTRTALEMDDFDLNSSFHSSVTSPPSSARLAFSSSGYEYTRKDSSYPSPRSEIFDTVGLPISSISSTFLWIQEKLTEEMNNEFLPTEAVDKQVEIIFAALQLTMHGLQCKYLITAIDALDPGVASIESSTASDVDDMVSKGVNDRRERSVISSDRICLPMVFPALLEFIQNDSVSILRRLQFSLALKTSMQSFDNYESVLKVHGWQSALFKCLYKEKNRSAELQEKFGASLPPNAAASAKKRFENGKILMENSEAICEVTLSMICDIHIHAICVGVPYDVPSIVPPGETVYDRENMISPKVVLEGLMNGTRIAGGAILKETIAHLRCLAQNGLLDVQTIGLDLLMRILNSMKRESDSLSSIKSESPETRAVRKRIIELNLWLMAAVILEFISLPMIQQARPQSISKRSSSPVVPLDDSVLVGLSGAKPFVRSHTTPNLHTARQLVKEPGEDAAEEMSPLTSLGEDGDAFEVSSIEEISALKDIMSPVTVSRPRGLTEPNPYELSKESLDSEVPTCNIRVSNEQSFSQKVWELIATLFDLLGPLESFSPLLNTVSGASGDRQGKARVPRVNFSQRASNFVDFIRSDDKNSSAGLRGTAATSAGIPPSRPMDSVLWVLVRVTLNMFLQGSEIENPTNDNPILISSLDKLRTLLAFVQSKAPEYYEVECLYLVSKVASAIRSTRLALSSQWCKLALHFLVHLVVEKRVQVLHLLHQGCERKLSQSDCSPQLIYVNTSLTKDLKELQDPAVQRYPRVDIDARANALTASTTMPRDKDEDLFGVIRMCLQGKTKHNSWSLENLTWDSWDFAVEPVLRMARNEEDRMLASRLTEVGLHKHTQEVWSQLQSQVSADKERIAELNARISDAVYKSSTLEEKRLREVGRQEDAFKKKIAANWNTILQELVNERGPWGAGAVDAVDVFWMIDPVESYSRMKCKLVRNPHGTRHTATSQYTAAMTIQEFTERRSEINGPIDTLIMASEGAEESTESDEVGDSEASRSRPDSSKFELWRNLLKYKYNAKQDSELDEDEADADDEDEADLEDGNQSENSNLTDDEKYLPGSSTKSVISTNDAVSVSSKQSRQQSDENNVLFTAECKIVTPSTNACNPPSFGTIEVTRTKITFTKTADPSLNSSSSFSLPSGQQRPIRKPQETVAGEKLWACQNAASAQWPTKDVYDVPMRYYNLRFVAVEIFFTSRVTVFIDFFEYETAAQFQNVIRRKVIPPYLVPFLGRKPTTIVANLTAMGQGTNISQAWANREISNFEYIMRLNTIAGRTFNDLGQYPIFPWVLADYESEYLNLRDPESFRDFRYPIGAQNKEQRRMAASRYHDLDSVYCEGDAGSLPPFHFGTHYSVAGFVLWYLMRIEPYTSLHIQLQDGKFDKADRLFQTMAATWRGCTNNASDVKELVPEMFYCPEIFLNLNNIDLGTTQNGRKLGEIGLPNWAKDPYDFVYQHREALESEFVSQNLHHWIDLIFGYKQRPPHLRGHPDAIEACNVFFHLTYADAVDLDTLKNSDPMLYNQYLCQISEFGQTPCQLFTKPHIQRAPLHIVDIIWPIASVVRGVDTIMKDKPLPGMPRRIVCKKGFNVSACPLLFIAECNDQLLTVDSSRVVGHHIWQVLSPDVVPPFKIKIDDTAYDISLGKLESKSALRRQGGVERRIGVPFASSPHVSAEVGNFDTALKWKPVKAKLYDKIERENRLAKSGGSNNHENLSSENQKRRGTTTTEAQEAPPNDTTKAFPGAGKPRPLPRQTHQEILLQAAGSGSGGGGGGIASDRGDSRGRSRTNSEVGNVNRPSSRRPTHVGGGSTGGGGSSSSAAMRGVVPTVMDDHLSSQLFAVVPDLKLIFSCGHWDHSLRASSTDNGKLIQSVIHHSDVVTCIAYAKDLGRHWLVTGSRDCTLMVWEISIEKDAPPLGSSPMHILYGHDDAVTTVAVNLEFDMIASGSEDGTIIVHNLHSGIYVRSIVVGANLENSSGASSGLKSSGLKSSSSFASFNMLATIPETGSAITTPRPAEESAGSSVSTPKPGAAYGGGSIAAAGPSTAVTYSRKIQWIGISGDGYLVCYAADEQVLTTFSLNGAFLASRMIPERLYAFVISEDGKVLLTGGDSCLVVLRWVRTLELANDGPRRGLEAILDGTSEESAAFHAPIRTLYLTKVERLLLVGLESGEMRALAQDSDYLRQRLQRKLIEIGIL